MFLFQESQTACLEIFRIETVKTFVVFIVSHMRKTKQFPDEFFVPACRKRRSRNNSAYRVVDGFFKLAVRYDTGYETSSLRFPLASKIRPSSNISISTSFPASAINGSSSRIGHGTESPDSVPAHRNGTIHGESGNRRSMRFPDRRRRKCLR